MPCKHGRQRSVCKECGGSGLCEHGRVCSVCKECGGSSLCEHGRRRNTCKECGESSVEESDGDYDVTPDDVNFDIYAMGKTRYLNQTSHVVIMVSVYQKLRASP